MASQDGTLYVLVTGANGGVGYSTCTRLISSFLTSRPASQKLHIIPSTRGAKKGLETKDLLLRYVRDLSTGQTPFYKYKRGGTAASLSDKDEPGKSLSKSERERFSERIIVTPLVMDLCSLRSVYDAAETVRGLVPRLDVLICNAGIGGWVSVNWLGFFTQIWEEGPLAAVGRPNYKTCRVGAATNKQVVIKQPGLGNGTTKVPAEKVEDEEPQLGEVFCANVFGHYVFAHQILSLLNRDDGESKARVVWVSTLEAVERWFDSDDLQGLESTHAYESSKRLTDFLSLNFLSPLSRPFTTSFLGSTSTVAANGRATRSRSSQQSADAANRAPRMLLSHPGICVTAIMPLHPILSWLEIMVFIFVRFIGSHWHTVRTDAGATSAVWLALEEDKVLDDSEADTKKWGSAADRWGVEGVLETPVDSLGTADFEKEGSRCWETMEELRLEWNELMDSP